MLVWVTVVDVVDVVDVMDVVDVVDVVDSIVDDGGGASIFVVKRGLA